MASPTDYLKDLRERAPADVSQKLYAIEEIYTKKLWHQLTVALQELVKDDYFNKGNELIAFYKKFITDFEKKLNPLALVELLCPYVIRQFTNSEEALEFLKSIKDKTKESSEAQLLCLTSIGSIKLLTNDFAATKTIIEECDEILNGIAGVTPVHSRFYELCSNYHQLLSNHNQYYKDALRYLGCVEMSTIPIEEQRERAFNLGLAGLLGDKIFNFGELLQHPVLESLKNTPRQWLVDLLFAFNSGNIKRMNDLKPYWSAQPDLVANELKLRQKNMLLCLMEMTFSRASNNRQIKFEEIASETGVPVEEVEILAMKAMSLGLVEGTIDQVEQKVNMSWVQPRVLDQQQVGKMKEKLEVWCNDVNSMEKMVSKEAEMIMT